MSNMIENTLCHYERKIKALEVKNAELERKLSSIVDDCITENAYEFSQYCQSIDYKYMKNIEALEAKNAELVKELELYTDKIFELEKKLEIAVEALEFYGKKESYDPWTEAYSEYTDYGRDYMCAIDCIQEDDTEKIIETLPLSKKEVSEWYGGKRAREALSKIKSGGL